MTAREIELAVVKHFGVLHPYGGMGDNRNMIIPNFKGFYLHECDLFIVTSSGYAWEVEIKTTLADLKADAKKWHKHESKLIRKLWFAAPMDVINEGGEEFIPAHAGIFEVLPMGYCLERRKPTDNPSARKLTDKERLHLGHIAAMRIWTDRRKHANR